MPGQRRLSFEFLDCIIRHPVNQILVGDSIVEMIEWKELEHLADNEDRVLFSTTTRVIFYFHVCNLYCSTNRRFEFLWGDCHRGGRNEGVIMHGDDDDLIRSPVPTSCHVPV